MSIIFLTDVAKLRMRRDEDEGKQNDRRKFWEVVEGTPEVEIGAKYFGNDDVFTQPALVDKLRTYRINSLRNGHFANTTVAGGYLVAAITLSVVKSTDSFEGLQLALAKTTLVAKHVQIVSHFKDHGPWSPLPLLCI